MPSFVFALIFLLSVREPPRSPPPIDAEAIFIASASFISIFLKISTTFLGSLKEEGTFNPLFLDIAVKAIPTPAIAPAAEAVFVVAVT